MIIYFLFIFILLILFSSITNKIHLSLFGFSFCIICWEQSKLVLWVKKTKALSIVDDISSRVEACLLCFRGCATCWGNYGCPTPFFPCSSRSSSSTIKQSQQSTPSHTLARQPLTGKSVCRRLGRRNTCSGLDCKLAEAEAMVIELSTVLWQLAEATDPSLIGGSTVHVICCFVRFHQLFHFVTERNRVLMSWSAYKQTSAMRCKIHGWLHCSVTATAADPRTSRELFHFVAERNIVCHHVSILSV